MNLYYRTLPALAILIALTACGGSGSGGDQVAVSGTSANLPMGLPLMAGATVASNNTGEGAPTQTNATATLTSTADAGDVVSFYQDALEDAGFSPVREAEAGDIISLTAMRDQAVGMVTVRPEGEATQIMIVLRDEPRR